MQDSERTDYQRCNFENALWEKLTIAVAEGYFPHQRNLTRGPFDVDLVPVNITDNVQDPLVGRRNSLRTAFRRTIRIPFDFRERPVKTPPVWLKQRSCQASSLVMCSMRKVSEKETSWLHTLRIWQIWTRQKSTLVDSMRKRLR